MRKIALLIAAALLPLYAYAATIDINTATAAELDTLSGIGPTKAAAIIDYRSKHGPFATIEDIQKVSGIGPVTFANIKSSITVGETSTSSAPDQQAQPVPSPVSYKSVQAVEPITSIKKALNDSAVNAPATTTEIVAAGAALAAPDPESQTQGSRAPELFSIWTFGLLGVMLLAGGAFIFL